ncbi:Conserved_hypothetical protein [Hexamita inflata]|uniref:Uncharacterized protein n=1 Tax=Hexamita inflata TaxID=28002 RepID=A0AA86TPW7_9EUKA|nr:Conserved hypothetical protein [Hexamita inflata]
MLQSHKTKSMMSREDQMYLTIIDEHAYFYADNYCYKCDYNLNVIEQQPIEFPYSLRKDIQNFPVFDHDFPQLFKSHECQDRYFTNVFDTIYEFSEFKVTKRVTLPDVDPFQVQKDIMLFYFGNSTYYLLYFNQEVKTLKMTVDYNIRSKNHEYLINNQGWSIDYKIINEIAAENKLTDDFNQRLALNANHDLLNNFTTLNQQAIKYLKYNSNFTRHQSSQNQLSSLQQTDYVIYLGLTKQHSLLEKCIQNKIIHNIYPLNFECLHDIPNIKLLFYLVQQQLQFKLQPMQNQLLQQNFVITFSRNPQFDSLNIQLTQENFVQDTTQLKFNLLQYLESTIRITIYNLYIIIIYNKQFTEQLFQCGPYSLLMLVFIRQLRCVARYF